MVAPPAPTGVDTRIVELSTRIHALEQEVNDLKQENRWLEDLYRLPATTISASEQKTLYALRKEARGRDPESFFKLDTRDLAKNIGQSPGTFRRNVTALAENLGLVEKKLEDVWYSAGVNEDGSDKRTKYTYLYVKPLEILNYPRLYTPQVERNHGGDRPGSGRKRACVNCQSENVDVYLTVYCRDCHYVHYEEEETGRNQLDFSHEDVTSPANDPDQEEENQVDSGGVEMADNQVDSLITSPKDDQLETVDPSIPPMVLDASQIEALACDLLLEIAGPGPEHIEMNTNPELSRKYTTVHRALHKGDMLAHLRGVRTKGATLRHPFGNTRALCFEGDTPEDWQRLKEAAVLLAAAGFKVMLEPSPAREGHVGGGHLWVVFDSYPDAYSARESVIDIAPPLAEVKEYWPNGGTRVRLPGGKYVTPDYEAWCHLYDAYENELSHDGAGAAPVLLEMQTPAALVKKHEKKTELVLTEEAITMKTVQASGGLLGQKADVLPAVLAEFEYSWDDLAEMAGGYNKEGYFPAKWRDDKNPNVKEWKGHDLARDFSTEAWPDCRTMDRHHVWCLLQAGENWREFRRLDLDQRCRDYRARQSVTA